MIIEEVIAVIIVLIIYVLLVMFALLLTMDDKGVHIKRSSRGIRNVLDEFKETEVDINTVANRIQLFYEQYVQENPSSKKYFNNSISWLDAVLVKVCIGRNVGSLSREDYSILVAVREQLNEEQPYSNCSVYQQGILRDMKEFETEENHAFINNIIGRTESEFIRLKQDIKKNEKANKLSTIIGVVGIILTAISFFKF